MGDIFTFTHLKYGSHHFKSKRRFYPLNENKMTRKTEIFTDCSLCYHSCGTKVTVEDGKAVKIRGLESHPLNKGRLCPKGANALFFC